MYLAINNPWPTDAAACCAARSFGRVVSPSGAKPAAIAPDETTKTSAPRDFKSATTFTIFSTDASSSAEPALPVRDEEPIFMTMRFALVTALRLIAHPLHQQHPLPQV